MGYAGGSTPDPTYHDLGDHTEVVQVDFDPSRISYEDLLVTFWQLHDARRPSHSTQYASVVLTSDADQLATARALRDRLAVRAGAPLATRIAPLDGFYPAEDYHQKYHWRHFAAQWAAQVGGDVPDWRSPEFERWMNNGGVVVAPAEVPAKMAR